MRMCDDRKYAAYLHSDFFLCLLVHGFVNFIEGSFAQQSPELVNLCLGFDLLHLARRLLWR